MPTSFDVRRLLDRLTPVKRDPRILVRTVLGILLAANLIAALFLLKPWATSADEMERQLSQLRREVKQKQASIARLQILTKKAVQARNESDQFMKDYFLDRRAAFSTIITELKNAADNSGVEQKEHAWAVEPIEGSENLRMMSITGSYEGEYENLVKFINLLDRSQRFLILSSLQAAPQRNAGKLNVLLRMNAFVIESGAGQQVQAAAANPASGRSGT